MKGLAERLCTLRHELWMRIVRKLIACLEADLRGRVLDWLYSHVEKDRIGTGEVRYSRSGGRYHREPRWHS